MRENIESVQILTRNFVKAKGPLDEVALEKTRKKRASLDALAIKIATLTGLDVSGRFITTADMPQNGVEALGKDTLVADVLSSELSDARMLNTGLEALAFGAIPALVSLSAVEGNLDAAAVQFAYMLKAYESGEFAMVGSIMASDHNLDLIDQALANPRVLNLGNVKSVFPTTAAAIVHPATRYSERTNKGVLGEGIKGSEGWYSALTQMNEGALIGNIISPYLGERTNAMATPEDTKTKLEKRPEAFQLYAEDIFKELSPSAVEEKINSLLIERFWLLRGIGDSIFAQPTLDQTHSDVLIPHLN